MELTQVTSLLTFDLWDTDGDMAITSRDLPSTLRDMDVDDDDRITVKEFLRYIERGYKLSRKLSGFPIQHPLVACPVPWWSPNGIAPSIDATRATMDFDDDFDGWISLDDLTRWVTIFDANDDQGLDADEFEKQQASRYGINASVAAAMFDMADTNGDGRLSEDDWGHHFQDDIEVSFCDARRSILDLVRLAEAFQDMQEGPGRKSAMKRRLQEEWRWYAQNNLMTPGGMGRPLGRARNRNLCQGRRACYEGEYTSAWGLPGASLWWASDVGTQWSEERMRMNPVDTPHPWSGIPTAPRLFPFRRSTYAQNTFRQQATAQSQTGQLRESKSFPFRQNNQDFFQSSQKPQSFSPLTNANQNNPAQDNVNPFFKRYQHLFGPVGRDSSKAGGQTTKGDSSPLGSRFDAMRNMDGVSGSRTSGSGQAIPLRASNFGTTQGNAAQGPRENAAGGQAGLASMSRDNMQQRQRFPSPARTSMPVIGVSTYPVVLGLDPWLLGGYPAWRWNGRQKRQRNENAIKRGSHEDVDSVKEKPEMESSGHIRVSREVSSRKEENVKPESSLVDDKKEDDNAVNDFVSWHPPLPEWQDFAFPPHPSPYDMWMAAMMERLLWESVANHTDGDLNSTEIGDIWDRMSQWLQTELEKSEEGEKVQDNMETDKSETNSRSKRDSYQATDNTDGILFEGNPDSQDLVARKQFIKSQRFRRNPYYNAIRNWMPRNNQMFGYSSSPGSFSASNYNDQWFGWPRGQRMSRFPSPWYMNSGNSRQLYFPNNNDYSEQGYARMRRKRHASGYSGGENINKDTLSNQLRRGLSFGKWLKTKGSGNSRLDADRSSNAFSPSTSSSNVWRGAVNEYGSENNWKEHLKSGSGQWGSSEKEKLDFSDEKWSSGKDPMMNEFQGWQSGSRNPSMGSNWLHALEQKLTSPNGYSSFGPNGKKGLPKNFAAFFVGRSPENGFGNPFRNVGVGGSPTSVYTSRPWNFPSQAFNVENNRWQDYSNNGYAGFNGSPMYKNLNGNNLAGWGGRVNLWNKRFANELLRQGLKDSDRDSTLTRKRRSSFAFRNYNLAKDDTKLRDTSSTNNRYRAERSNKQPFGSDSYENCKNYQPAGMGQVPWRSWNVMRSRFSRQTQKGVNMVLSEDDAGGTTSGRTLKAKRQSSCYVDKANNQLQHMSEDFDRLRRMARWAKQNGWTSQDWYPWAQGHWNRMRHPSKFSPNNWYPWSFNNNWSPTRHQRNSDQKQTEENDNEFIAYGKKRDTIPNDRDKRWNDMLDQNSAMFSYPWLQGNWNGMRYPSAFPFNWDRLSSSGNWNLMRYPRNSEKLPTDEKENPATVDRPKREAMHSDRNKRWNAWWNQNPKMYSYQWRQGNWNGRNWNGMGYPAMQFSNWYPWSSFGNWNSMRYPRDSKQQETEEYTQSTNARSKREAEHGVRDKRWNNWWNQNSMMYSYPWSEGNWNGMKYPAMYSSNWLPWSSFGNWNSMRYPRNSENHLTEDEGNQSTNNVRSKRKAIQGDRAKRWNNWWNQNSMSQWNWNEMRYPTMFSSNWYPWSSFGNWNSMRYPRESKDQETEKYTQSTNARSKREATHDVRDKRWNNGWNHNSVMYSYPWRHGNWNGITWNGMRYPSMQSSNWYPWSSSGNWNSMRFPRNSEQQQGDEEDNQSTHVRTKRQAIQGDRKKRWNNWWNQNSMMYSFPMWQGNWNRMRNPSMYSSNWYPWSFPGNWNSMRYPRNSQQQEEERDNESTNARSKREVIHGDRDKRWNNWWNQNSMSQGKWNGMNWNGMKYPSMHSYNWYPWSYFGNWNSMRFPRNSEQQQSEEENIATTRSIKREAIQSDRDKRWNNWWNQNSMMYSYPMWQGNWNGKRNPSVYSFNWYPGSSFENWNSMRYPRDSEQKQTGEEDNQSTNARSKREAMQGHREKRWNNWRNPNSRMYSYPWNQEMWNGINRNGMRYPSMQSSNWYPWSSSGSWNSMRFPRNAEQQEGDQEDNPSTNARSKREAIHIEREKRWNDWWNQNSMSQGNWNAMNWNGMRYPAMQSSNWYPWSSFGNSMRFPRDSTQQVTEEDHGSTNARTKREAIQGGREKMWNNWRNLNSRMYSYPWNQEMWNGMNWNGMRYPSMQSFNWYPWSSSGNWNSMRFPRNSEQQEGDEDKQPTNPRAKREAIQGDRDKRWNNWWNQNSMMYSYPMWQGNWNGMRNPSVYSFNWYPWSAFENWNSMRYPRNSEQQEGNEGDNQSTNARSKREAIQSDREKRWNNWRNPNSMMYSYPWSQVMWNGMNWNGMRYPSMQSSNWYPWSSSGSWNSMRFPRNSEEQEGEEDKLPTLARAKREAIQGDRDKRWNNWWSQNSMSQGNLNGMNWNGMRYPSMYAFNWNPMSSFDNWNSMRYARDSEQHQPDSENTSTAGRSKREAVLGDRQKRWNNWWNRNSMMYSYPWWQGNWNGMRYPSMQSSNWYPWSSSGSWNSMRFPRNSEQQERDQEDNPSTNARSKREAINIEREKRWNDWWNQNSMSQGNRNGMNWNGMRYPSMYAFSWFPMSSFGNWNSMRFPRHSEQQEGEEDKLPTLARAKREAIQGDRDKRWNNWWSQNSMSQGNLNGMNWNGMRYPSMYAFSWNPMSSFDNWNSMRYARDSEQHQPDSENTSTAGRSKREAVLGDRQKRWNNWWNRNSMMYSYPWWQGNWNGMRYPSMQSSNWYPWSSSGSWNPMRFPRNSEQQEGDQEDNPSTNARSKREAINIEREKRWNDWWNQNSMSQGNRNGMNWNGMRYPSIYAFSWFPMSSFGNWNSMRFPRHSEQQEREEDKLPTLARAKREAIEGDRDKRWNNWWNRNSMMYSYPWWQGNWNGMRYPSMQSSNWYPWSSSGSWNSMRFPRNSEQQEGDEEGNQSTNARSKREAIHIEREKRWNDWWNQNSMSQGNWNAMNWNGMRYPAMQSSNWYPWSSFGNSMRFPRDSKQQETEEDHGSTNARTKREAIQGGRDKRWNNGWNQNSAMYSYPRNQEIWNGMNWNGMKYPSMHSFNSYPWSSFENWNSMRHPRNSEQQQSEEENISTPGRSKREATQGVRDKRWNNWWNQNSMMYAHPWSQGNWNGMRYPSMISWNWFPGSSSGNWNSMRFPRNSEQHEGDEKDNQSINDRSKREAIQGDRQKRWNNWWNQNSMMYSYPSSQGNWNGMNWNGMKNPNMFFSNRYPWSSFGNWNSMRYPRNSEQQQNKEELIATTRRTKREAIHDDRQKRWNNCWNQNSMMFPYPWWQGSWNGMKYPSVHSSYSYPLSFSGNWNSMRYPRHSEQQPNEEEDIESTNTRSKREAIQGDRQNRWNSWWNQNSVMYPYPLWQGNWNWNGMDWNGIRYPSKYSSNWYPWSSSGTWNSMRYPRDSEQQQGEERDDESTNARSKREAIHGDRDKRWNNWWNQNSMSQDNWNGMRYPSIYSFNWYPWSSSGTWNSMRYPRNSEQQGEERDNESTNTRTKREAIQGDRTKRWNNWWNHNSMMYLYSYPWSQGNWDGMNSNGMRYPSMYSPNGYPWSNFGNWNSIRYPRNSAQQHTEAEDSESTNARSKREAIHGYRDKRWNNWWNQNSMMYPFPRSQGNWNGMNWNEMEYPSGSSLGNWNSMRYPRNSEKQQTEDENVSTQGRPKREAKQGDREKRWNNWWNQNSMMYSYPWSQGNWNGGNWKGMKYPSMFSPRWYPWSSFGNWNSMRFPRNSEEQQMGDEEDKSTNARSKREVIQGERAKRWNNWWSQNSIMYSYPWSQGNQNGMNWNGMGYPAMYSFNRYPLSSSDNWNSMRYPRNSEKQQNEQKNMSTPARSKRETMQSDRQKRWNNNWWNQRSMMFPYPLWQGNWNGMRYPSMYSSGNWNSMRFPRDGDQQETQDEDKQMAADRSTIDKSTRDNSVTSRSKRRVVTQPNYFNFGDGTKPDAPKSTRWPHGKYSDLFENKQLPPREHERHIRSLDLTRHGPFQEESFGNRNTNNIAEKSAKSKITKKREGKAKPMFSTLKSYLSRSDSVSKVYRTAMKGPARNEARTKKRTWDSMATRSRLMNGGLSSLNKNWVSGGRGNLPGNNDWFMGWIIKNSHDNGNNVVCDPTNGWNVFCARQFWYNAMMKAFWNRYMYQFWMRINNNNGNNMAYPRWFPPLTTGSTSWHPFYPDHSTSMFPWTNTVGKGYNSVGSANSNGFWNRMTGGWDPTRWPRDVAQKLTDEDNEQTGA